MQSMYEGKLIFSQLMDFVPWRRFQTCVKRYRGDYKVKTYPCAEQFRVMAFAQLTYRHSLREIETCLRAVKTKLYHMGIRSTICHSNLAHANNQRDWRIYADFAQVLIQRAKQLYLDEDLGLDLDATVYALDASTIDLCLSMFPWAKFRKAKGAVKLHTLMNLQGSIPEFILISDGKLHDVNVLDYLLPVPGAYYVMDRGYLDFERLYAMHQAKAYFVTRAKRNFTFKRRYSHEVDKSTGVQCDQTIVLKTFYSFQGYPEPIRRIRYYDENLDKRLVFLTNNFELPATTIAALYKSRWQIELFFKWIKQHLRIKSFYGTSQNAVKSQIWIAVSTYLLVAIVKKELRIDLPLYTILQILSLVQFEKTPILQALSTSDYKIQEPTCRNQLLLFE
jgi:transposase